MPIRVLDGGDIRRALPMPRAIEAMKRAFIAYSSGQAEVPQRLALNSPAGLTLVKPAYCPGPPAGLGAKLVSVFPNNLQAGKPAVTGLVVLLDPESGEPAALLAGAALTAWRTGAASGAATELLARKDARIGAVFGAGPQARTQILAIDAARQLERIRIYAPRRERVAALIAGLAGHTRAALEAASSPEAAIASADVICAATNSKSPVFNGAEVADGCHINGVGSFRPDMIELDPALIRRSKIAVDARASALAEAGELMAAAEAGLTRPEDWTELGAIAAGAAPGRRDAGELTLFKSVGLAVQDIVAGAAVLAAAEASGLGQLLSLDEGL